MITSQNVFAALDTRKKKKSSSKSKESEDKKKDKKATKADRSAELERAIFSAPKVNISNWADTDDDDDFGDELPDSWSAPVRFPGLMTAHAMPCALAYLHQHVCCASYVHTHRSDAQISALSRMSLLRKEAICAAGKQSEPHAVCSSSAASMRPDCHNYRCRCKQQSQHSSQSRRSNQRRTVTRWAPLQPRMAIFKQL